MKPAILIAGATGATGRAAASLLLEKRFPVRAFVHREDERSRQLADQGVEIVVGDLLALRAVRRAFDGVKRAYFVYPMRPGLMQATAYYAQAATEAETEFIVNMSQRSAGSNATSDSTLQHWLAERVFDRTGIPLTHLRPTVFANWLLYMRKMIRDGRYSVPWHATGRFASIAAEDQGVVIATILTDPSSHAGQTYPLFGPLEQTPPEIAETVGRVLGKSIRYQQITSEQWVWEVAGQKIPFLSQHLSGIARDHERNGLMAGTNDLVERITERRPTSLEEFVEKHRAAFQ